MELVRCPFIWLHYLYLISLDVGIHFPEVRQLFASSLPALLPKELRYVSSRL
jgi:hypothetical protein